MTIPPVRKRRRLHRWRLLLLGLSLVPAFCLVSPASVQSQAADPHALFEERCGRCHGHAGAFAHQKLTIDEGEVVGQRSGKSVLKTLSRHFGKVTDAEARLIADMFRRQIEAGGLYASKCRICHDPAKNLARRTLVFRDGQLVGRYSDRAVRDFLSFHGRLHGDEREVMLDMLAWQLVSGNGRVPSASDP